MPAFLKKEIAGIPVGIWLVVIAGGVVAGIYLRKRNQEDEQSTGEEYTTDGSTEVVPYGDLPSDPYQLPGGGYYGPPSISGGGAIRLLGPRKPIRIIISQRKPRKRGDKDPKHGGKGGPAGGKRGR